MTVGTEHKESAFRTTADVEKGVAVLNKILHRNGNLSAKAFAGYFEKLHANAAWSGIEALADIADRVWNLLDTEENEADLTAEKRQEIAKALVTYKFLLSRKVAHESAA